MHLFPLANPVEATASIAKNTMARIFFAEGQINKMMLERRTSSCRAPCPDNAINHNRGAFSIDGRENAVVDAAGIEGDGNVMRG